MMGRYLEAARRVVGPIERAEPATISYDINDSNDIIPGELKAGHVAGNTIGDDALPAEWREGLDRLAVMPCPSDIPPERWQQAIDDAVRFAQQFGPQAHSFGWSTGQLFGVHQVAPIGRLDSAGLVLLLRDRELVTIDKDKATIKTASGKYLSFYRNAVNVREGRLLWEAPHG